MHKFEIPVKLLSTEATSTKPEDWIFCDNKKVSKRFELLKSFSWHLPLQETSQFKSIVIVT